MSNAPVEQSEQALPSTEGSAPRRNDLLFAVLVSFAYLSLLLIQLTHHVMWRDEIRPWQIIGQCSSVSQMIAAMRYDAVPPLWNLIVYGLTRLTDDPRSMQIVHSLIATGVVFVFAMWGPFPRWIKLLFPLGYFPLFEYGVITRSYSLVFVLLLIACELVSRERANLIAIALLLALLTLTSIWGAGFAVLLAGVVGLRAYKIRKAERPKLGRIVPSILIVVAGFILFAATITPGPGPSFAPRIGVGEAIVRIPAAVETVTRAWLPIPMWSTHFWNTNILDRLPLVELMIAIVLLVIVLRLLGGEARWFFITGITGLLVFEAFHAGGMRHQGHLFMLLIASLWINSKRNKHDWRRMKQDAEFHPSRRPSPPPSPAGAGEGGWLPGAVLCVHAIAGVGVAIAGMVLPFSASRQVNDYIKTQFNLDQVVLVGVPDYCVSPICQWLGRPIYFPDMKSFARVNIQDDAKRPGVNGATLLPELYGLIRTEHKPALLIAEADFSLVEHDTTLPIDPANPDGPALSIRVLPEFPDSIVATEAARLYLINIAR
jgi:hypothetical protein